jgi:hypothetical protein
MTDARSRELKPDSISKLERIFKKQLLNWARVEGLAYLDELDLDLDALLSFRSTWTEGAIVRSKKQECLKGFFWACFRRNYISQIPALGLGKIKTGQIPTDYFPQDEFDKPVLDHHRHGEPSDARLYNSAAQSSAWSKTASCNGFQMQSATGFIARGRSSIFLRNQRT